MALPEKSENYISLHEATKLCEHSQEYLSLRARQGKLKAIKFGRNWVTKKEWVEEYLSGIENYKNNLNGKKKNKKEEKKLESDARLTGPPKNLPIGDFQLYPVSPLSFRASQFFKKELIKAIASPAIRTGFAIVLIFVLLFTGLILGRASLHQTSKDAGLYETIDVFSEYAQWMKQNIEKVPGVKEFTRQISRETKIVQENRKENFSLIVSAFEKINSGVVNAWNRIASLFQKTAIYVFRTLIEGWLDIRDAYLAVRDLININISLADQKVDQWTKGFFERLRFITYPWRTDRPTRLVVDQSELEALKQEIETLKQEGIIAKELIKEIEVSKITKIEEIEQTIQQYVQIDDIELAMFKSQLEDLDSWKTDIASKIQSYPGNSNIPTAPIYISSPGGIKVGGHGSFVSLGVQGSVTGDTLSIRGATHLGTNPNLSSDILTVGMTSTFQQVATFEQGIAPNLGIGDTSADYPLEVLSTSTQFAITNTDETAYTEFFVNSDGDLNIKPSGGNVTINDAYTLPETTPSNDQILKYDSGTGLVAWETDAGGTPGGSNGQIQYNNGGDFGGTTGFVWDDVNSRVGIGDATPDYIVEILDTTTQLTLTYDDGIDDAQFFVDGNGDLTINPSGGNITFAVTSGSYTFPDATPTDNQIMKYDAGTGLVAWEADGGGAGSITAVGDCATGDCFTGTSGTQLTFNNVGGDGILLYNTDFSFDKQLGINDTTPNASLEVVTSGTSLMLSSTASADGDLFIVDSNGDVGIGEAFPEYKLEVLDTSTQLLLSYSDQTDAHFYVDGNGDLFIDPSGNNITFAVSGGSYTFPSGAPADNQILKYDVGTGLIAWEVDVGGAGSGDIDSVGNCASGACFDGTSGTTLTFNNAGGDGILLYNGDFSFDKPLGIGDTIPNAALEVVTSGTSLMLSSTASGDGDLFIVNSNGDVGIGDTTPDYKLEVLDTSTQLALTNVDASKYAEFYVDGDGDLMIATNNGELFKSDNTNESIVIGDNSGATLQYVTALGYGAGLENTQTAITAVGRSAGYQNTGTNQSAFGVNAGYQNTGTSQSAFGSSAGYQNTGTSQSAFGNAAGYQNEGASQSAFGYNAGRENTGNQVIGIGYEALRGNTGNDVVAIGYRAGKNNTRANQLIIQQTNIRNIPLIQGNFSTGLLGINEPNPTALLEVSTGSGSSAFFKLSNAASGDIMIVDSSGNVGIGDAGPDATLEVVSGSAGDAPFMVSSVEGNDGDWLIVDDQGNVGIGDTTPDASLEIVTSGDNPAFMISRGTEGDGDLFYVDAEGNVGIGTSSPNANLHLGTSNNIGDETNPVIQIGSTSNYRLGFYTTSEGGVIENKNGDTGIIFMAKNPTIASEIMRIALGNVGIGEISPETKLEVLDTNTQLLLTYADGTDTEFFTDINGDLHIEPSGSDVHIEGQCVTGDSLLPIVKEITNSKSQITNKSEITNSNNQNNNQNSLEFESLDIGACLEFGACDLEFKPIKDVQEDEYVLSFNEQTKKIEPHRINGLLDMGVKPVYKLTTESGKTIRTTGNHPYLARKLSFSTFNNNVYSNNPSQSQNNTSSNIEKSFNTNHSNLVLSSLAFGFKNIINNNCSDQSDNCAKEIENNNHNNYNCGYCGLGFSTKTILTTHSQIATNNPNKAIHAFPGIIEEIKKGITKEAKKICPRLENMLETTFTCSKDNLDSSINYNYIKDQHSMSNVHEAEWTKVIYLQEGDEIAVYNENEETYRGRASVTFERIVSIEYVGEEQVYDIEVENTHNFVANGIIAHNTYISGNTGIGDSSPDYKLEVLDTNTQLTLTYVDGTETRFFTDINGDLHIEPSGGNVAFTNYMFPSADGSSSQVLTTDGSGLLSWSAVGGLGDKILEGDTEVEVIDSGSGYIEFTVDATEIARMTGTRMGINDSDPDAVLEITTGTQGDDYFYISTNAGNDGDIFKVDSNGDLNLDSNTLYVDASTNRVGIGTTGPTSALDISYGGKSLVLGADLDVWTRTDATVKYGRILGAHYTNVEEPVGVIYYSSLSGSSGVYIGGGTSYGNAATNIYFYTASNSTTLTGTQRMTIDSAGDVGIGEASPETKLEVLDTNTQLLLTYVDGTDTEFFTDVNGDLHIEPSGGDIFLSDSGTLKIPALTSGSVVFAGAGGTLSQDNPNFYWDDGNNRLGIGTTNPTTPLTVSGEIKATTLTITGSSFLGAAYASKYYPSPAASDLELRLRDDSYGHVFQKTDGSELVRITSTGNVGIGDTSPDATLEVVSGSGEDAPFMVSSAEGTDGDWLIVDDQGNVGIGTTTPSQKFHVEGLCVTGDSLLPIVKEITNSKSQITNKSEITNSNNQNNNQNSLEFESLDIGACLEFGACDLEFKPIKDVQEGEYVLSLNEQTKKIEPHRINGLLDMGVKPVYKLTTESGKTIRTTGNHPYLAIKKAGSESSALSVAFEKQPACLSPEVCFNYSKSESLVKGLMIENKNGLSGPGGIRTRNVQVIKLSALPIKLPAHAETTYLLYQNKTQDATWTKVIYLSEGDEIAVVDDKETYRGRASVTFERIISIEYAGEEQVYDIEVENTHNFVANGIIAHNTYISGNTGIGDSNPDYKLEVLDTATQLSLAYTDGSVFTDFSVNGSGDLNIEPTGGNITFNGIYTFPSVDGSSNQFIQTDGSGTLAWATALTSETGDIETIGDCTSGACFNGTQGTTLTFNNASGDGILLYNTDFSFDKQLGINDTTPNASLEVVTSGTSLMLSSSAGADGDLFIVNSSGDVGIGEASPETKLEVLDTNTQLLLTYADGTDTEFFTDINGDLHIEPSGNDVFIPSLTQGSVLFAGLNGQLSQDNTNLYWDDGNNRLGIGDNTPDAALEITTGTQGDDYFYISTNAGSDGDILKVDSSGNVGIGTTSPQSILNINGGTGSLASGLTFGDGNTGFYEIVDNRLRIITNGLSLWDFSSSGMIAYASNNKPSLRWETTSITNPTVTPYSLDTDTGIGGDGSDALSLITGGSSRILINASGNVGIVDTSPDAALEITTTTVSGSYLMLSTDTAGDGDVLIVDNNGDVGIGDTSPDYKLEIIDTATQLTLAYADATQWAEFLVDGSGNLNIDASGGTTYVHGALSINDLYTFPTGDGGSSQYLQTDGSGTLTWATSSGSGDVTAVGNCSTGDCFDGSASGGTQLTFYDASGNGILLYNTDFSFDKQLGINDTTPNASLEVVTSGTSLMLSSSAGADGDLFIVNSSGDVGIGEASPETKLEVLDTNTQLLLTYVDGTDTEFFVDPNGDLHIEPSGGNVAFTNYMFPSADGSSSQVLTTDGSGALSWSAVGGLGDKISEGDSEIEVIDAGSGYLEFIVDNAEIARMTGTRMGINDSDPDAALEITTGTGSDHYFMISEDDDGNGNIFIVDSSGDVGIGTTSLNEKLTVSSSGASPDSVVMIESSIATNTDVTQGIHLMKNLRGSLYGWKIEGSGEYDADATLDFIAKTQSSEKTYLTIERLYGEVGIGDTSPDAILEIVTNSVGDKYLMVSSEPQNDGDIFIIDSNGDVGIGETSPEYRLEVLDNATQLLLSYSDQTDAHFYVDSSGDLFIDPSGNNITFAVSGGSYTFPSGGPADNQILKYDVGTGLLAWEADVGAGAFDSTAVDDTTWSDGSNAANTWTFNVSGTDHTMIAGDGLMAFSNDVGIGGDPTPDATLEIVSGSAGTAPFMVSSVAGGDGDWLKVNDLGDLNADSGTLFVDASTNRVGIGDVGPDYKLEILATTTQLALTNVDASKYAEFYVDGDGDLMIATNNGELFKSDYTNESIVIGDNSGHALQYVTALGYGAGLENTQTAITAVGHYAGYQNTKVDQSAFGYSAGYQNTGIRQSAFGYYAGRENTGSLQSAFGPSAGYQNTGSLQSVFGSSAGYQNTGSLQSAFGYVAGYQNTGSNQSAFGYYAGYQNTGNDVVAIGYEAGRGNTTSNRLIIQQNNINTTPLILGDFNNGFLGVNIDRNPQAILEITTGGESSNTFLMISDTGAGDIMTILSTGNVGIGETSPEFKLEVLDNATQLLLSYSDQTDAHFYVDSSGDLFIDPSGNNITFAVSGGSYTFPSGPPANNQILKYDSGTGLIAWEADAGGAFDSTAVDDTTWSDGNNATNTWTFNVSGTNHTMIAGDGLMAFSNDVGIGGDSTPDATLEVVSGSAGTAPFMVSSVAANDGDWFIVDDQGRVGIGNNNPQYDFVVNDVFSITNGVSDPTVSISASANEVSGNAALGISGGPGGANIIDFWNDAGTTQFGEMDSMGDLGIGNFSSITPDYNLEVLDTVTQFAITNTDNVDYAEFFVDSDGYLRIEPSAQSIGINAGPDGNNMITARFTEASDGTDNYFMKGSFIDSGGASSSADEFGYYLSQTISGTVNSSATQTVYGNYIDMDSTSTIGSGTAGTQKLYGNYADVNYSGALGGDTGDFYGYGAYYDVTGAGSGLNVGDNIVYGVYASANGDLGNQGTEKHYGGYFETSGVGDTNYGVYTTVTGSSTFNYGTYTVANGAGSNYGIYATASGGAANYAAWFNAGNVGIGDGTPDYKLEVLATTTQLALTNVDATTWAEFYVDGSGNLNVDASGGTTYVHGALSINDLYTFPVGDGGASQYMQTDGSGTVSWASAGASNAISQLNSNVTVTDAGSGNITFTVDGTEIARVVGSNFGISDTTPDFKLEVLSTTTQLGLSYEDGVEAQFWVDASGDLRLEPSGGDIIFPAGTTLGAGEEGDIQFFDGDASGENYEIEIYGWIGTTAEGTFVALSLDDANDEFLIDVADADGDTTLDIAFQLDDSAGSSVFRIRDDQGTEVFELTSDGNIGLGTTNPGGGTGSSILSIASTSAMPTAVANVTHLFSLSGAGYWMDGSGNAVLQTPHDPITGEWIFYSKNTNTGKELRVDMEKLVKFIDKQFNTDFVKEYQDGQLLLNIDDLDSILSPTTDSTAEIWALDENGDIIATTSESDKELFEDPGILKRLGQAFINEVKDALSWLGLTIESGIAKIKEVVTDRLTTMVARIERIEMVDAATGEVYCTWIENGEWVKVKSSCDDLTNDQNPITNDQSNPNNQIPMTDDEETSILETTTPSSEPVLEWCDNSHLGLCDTQELCESIGLYWYGEQCHLQGEAVIEPQPTPEVPAGEAEPEPAESSDPAPEGEPEAILEITTPIE